MLLAPMLPMSSTAAPKARSRLRQPFSQSIDPIRVASQRHWVLSVWLVLGTLAVLCIPPLRGSMASGLTLPFWLIGAPLVNLFAIAWAQRRASRHRR